MSRYRVELMEKQEQRIQGLGRRTNDRMQGKAISLLSKRLHQILGEKAGTLLPFYVLSKGYNPSTGNFSLFVAGEGEEAALKTEVIPAGIYARVEVKPLFGFLWGPAIGGAKRWFYNVWLPANPYEAVNLEYEYHGEKSLNRPQAVDLFFAIRCNVKKIG